MRREEHIRTQVGSFILCRSVKNGMKVVQMDIEGVNKEGSGIKGLLRCPAPCILSTQTVNLRNLYTATLWGRIGETGLMELLDIIDFFFQLNSLGRVW